MSRPVLLARADLGRGRLEQARCTHGRVAEIGTDLRPGADDELVDCAGGRVLHGLHDHHIHLLSAAARSTSFAFDDLAPASADRQLGRLAEYASRVPAGSWIRAVGFDETVGGWIDRTMLDAAVPGRPVRVQHRSGHAWLASTAAVDRLHDASGRRPDEGGPGDLPGGWSTDDPAPWPVDDGAAPDLAPLGRQLAAYGVSSVTDATPQLSPAAIALLDTARRSGDLPQAVELMCADEVEPSSLRRGPYKILLPADTENSLAMLAAGLPEARRQRRAVAVHCVTVEQLVLTLEAIEAAGPLPGDRIEHASLVPDPLIPRLRRSALTVVTQPGFVADRGDRYLDDPDVDESDLYRLASLRSAGIAVLAGSDAPFGPMDPWAIMRSAVCRRTPRGRPLGPDEAVDVPTALDLFRRPAGTGSSSTGPADPVVVGDAADLCVLRTSWPVPVADLDASLVAATVIDGRLAHRAAAPT